MSNAIAAQLSDAASQAASAVTAGMTETDKLALRLLARQTELETLMGEWKVIEDLLDGPSAMRTPTYLPQHLSESDEEYKRRKTLTPLFAETPDILKKRQGALFRQPPTLELPAKLKMWEESATLKGQTVQDVMARTSSLMQFNGFCGCLIDREALPPDVQGRKVNEKEKQERRLGRLILALYRAASIYAWGHDDRGLAWVRLVETRCEQKTWESKPVKVHTVRIVDREKIVVYRVEEVKEIGAASRFSVNEIANVPHDAKDAAGQPCVPFRFFHPFPGTDDIGRPVLKEGAEADAAAFWVLSELLWIGFCLAPILTLTTAREDAEIELMPIGASRFVPLKSKNAASGQEEEKLQFTSYDGAPMDRLKALYEMLAAKAKESGGKTGATAVPLASEASGISKAWSFKTSEERTLFMLALELTRGFLWIFETAARMEGTTDRATLKFPESFDIADANQSFDSKIEQAETFRAYGINEAVIQLLLQAAEIALPNMDKATWAEIKTRIESIKEQELRPGALLDKALEKEEEKKGQPPEKKPGEKQPEPPKPDS